jgi:hypothetical protein
MPLAAADFTILTLDDELRVDALCRDLLMAFYQDRLDSGLDEHDSTQLANSADYFLRDFAIGCRQVNILEETSGLVRQFAGNWYIVNTLEPAADELARHLKGIREFYHYLHRRGAVPDAMLAGVDRETADLDYYAGRITSFWEIADDGYYAWERECSLRG